jgi:hypothetical protein
MTDLWIRKAKGVHEFGGGLWVKKTGSGGTSSPKICVCESSRPRSFPSVVAVGCQLAMRDSAMPPRCAFTRSHTARRNSSRCRPSHTSAACNSLVGLPTQLGALLNTWQPSSLGQFWRCASGVAAQQDPSPGPGVLDMEEHHLRWMQ